MRGESGNGGRVEDGEGMGRRRNGNREKGRVRKCNWEKEIRG